MLVMRSLSVLVLVVVACCPLACGGSVDASPSPVVDASSDAGNFDGGKADVTVDSAVDVASDVSTSCPQTLVPEGACAVEMQTCQNHGCSSGQDSELTCYCSNKKWMCAALSCPEEDASADVDADVDTITAFVNTMNGIWLVGWSGGLRHYSWVRITSDSSGQWTGTAEFLSGEDISSNSPYWACSGKGTWMIPQKVNSILFTFPSSCPSGIEMEYTFEFSLPMPYPPGASLAAVVSPLSGSQKLEGYKFPDSQCDATMSTCIDPFK